MRRRAWVCGAATVLLPGATLLLLLVPPSKRAASDEAVQSTALLLLTICLTASAVALFGSGRDSFHLDDAGLHVRSTRHGDRDIPWGDLLELGWADGGHNAPSGLAGRRRTGGRYEPGGPSIAGWLAQPALRVPPPRLLQELRRRCQQHDVEWRDYVPAEVM